MKKSNLRIPFKEIICLSLYLLIPSGYAADAAFVDCRRVPDALEVVTANATVPMQASAGHWTGRGITVTTTPQNDGLHVTLASPTVAVKTLHLHWNGTPDPTWKYLGDAWERAYGDLAWKPLDGKRPLPWYVLASNGTTTPIREASGDGLVIGCDTVGHLAAGVFELNRIGDDTSGKEWSRTSKGVNTLAFRAAQHGTFFAVDADCVGQTEAGAIPWEKNRQWLDLLARSGTPLFISFKPGSTDEKQDSEIAAALDAASRPLPLGEPLDWFDTLTPQRWRLDGRETTYHW